MCGLARITAGVGRLTLLLIWVSESVGEDRAVGWAMGNIFFKAFPAERQTRPLPSLPMPRPHLPHKAFACKNSDAPQPLGLYPECGDVPWGQGSASQQYTWNLSSLISVHLSQALPIWSSLQASSRLSWVTSLKPTGCLPRSVTTFLHPRLFLLPCAGISPPSPRTLYEAWTSRLTVLWLCPSCHPELVTEHNFHRHMRFMLLRPWALGAMMETTAAQLPSTLSLAPCSGSQRSLNEWVNETLNSHSFPYMSPPLQSPLNFRIAALILCKDEWGKAPVVKKKYFQ